MKKLQFLIALFSLLIGFTSCQNKTKKLISKKWDCVKVENLAPVNKNLISQEDSLVTAKLETALQNLSWTFLTNNTYQCTTMGIVTTQGEYALSNDAKELTCTTNNNSIRYGITLLTEQDLVLQGYTNAVPIIMYFKPH